MAHRLKINIQILIIIKESTNLSKGFFINIVFFSNQTVEWKWIDIVKPPQVKTIPDIVTPAEVDMLIAATRKLRYRVFIRKPYLM